jgi:hypothetical protein
MEATPGTDEAPGTSELDQSWIRDFYKECGREVTLAYTTLNQMKNWAIVVQGAILAAVVSLNKPSPGASSPNPGEAILSLQILIAAVLAHLFTLRFFVRAMLCYGNLIRWNRLQSLIINNYLWSNPCQIPRVSPEHEQRELRALIGKNYHRWLSPLPRARIIAANIQLGFGLLLLLPAVLIAINSWHNRAEPVAGGFLLLALFGTAAEVYDFSRSSFFDDEEAHERRKTSRDPPYGLWSTVWPWLLSIGLALVGGLFWTDLGVALGKLW